MRAWTVMEIGEPEDVLQLRTAQEPDLGPGEVKIRVEAAAVNFFDNLLCRGTYQEHPPLPFTPGAEVAGRVVAAGDGARLKEGQRVLATPALPRGGWAEMVCVTAESAYEIPEAMTMAEAAALFINYQTARYSLRRANLRRGDVLLVHAGAGGVGSAAIQLGAAAGARVIATAGGPEKGEICCQQGAEIAVDYLREDFSQVVKDATGGRGADVVFDPVGGDVTDLSRKCIAPEGRILIIGFAGGRVAQIPANHMLVKNYDVVGIHWGLWRRLQPHGVDEAHEAIVRAYARGEIHPLVGRVCPFEDAPKALAALTARETWGKVVLQV